MSATHDTHEKPVRGGPTGEPALYLAEYDTPGACMHAAEKLRDAGYKAFDTHTPFPVHGMDQAMGMKDTPLGLIVFGAGATGCGLALLMMWWMNGVDYPLIVGGKPPFALPAVIPELFEITVLFSAFTAVFAMLGLSRLPRHHHPIFNSDRFDRFSDDKFFVSVEATDDKFDLARTRELLESTHPTALELVKDDQ